LTKAKYRNLAQKIDTVKSPECYKYYKTNIAENAIGFILDSYLAMEAKNSWKYW
jgi:hypothetical protein